MKRQPIVISDLSVLTIISTPALPSGQFIYTPKQYDSTRGDDTFCRQVERNEANRREPKQIFLHDEPVVLQRLRRSTCQRATNVILLATDGTEFQIRYFFSCTNGCPEPLLPHIIPFSQKIKFSSIRNNVIGSKMRNQ